MNEVINVINNRSSLRRFSGNVIPKEQKDRIINSALRAPTAGNLMLYSIIKVEQKSTLASLSKTCDNQPFIKTADFALIFVVDFQRLYDYFSYNNYFSYCKEQDTTPQFPDLSDLLLGSEDAMCAAQNSVLAAESIGVGSCYIGDIMEQYEIHKKLFHLQPLTFPLAMVVFGEYPKGYKPMISERFDAKYVVFNETYKRLSKADLSEVYKLKENSFIENNKYQAKNAAQYLYARKVGNEFSKEMRRSVTLAFQEWMKYKKDGIALFNTNER